MNASVPFETTWAVKDTCLCLHAQRAARALARRFDEALKPAGLTNAQFSLVNALNGPEPAGLAKLARILGADRTTLTAALKLLGRRGLTETSADPNDRRVKRVWLTDAGYAVLAAAMPLWRAAHDQLEAGLADTDPAQVRQGLLALSNRHEDEET